jgi:hypothetical protein
VSDVPNLPSTVRDGLGTPDHVLGHTGQKTISGSWLDEAFGLASLNPFKARFERRDQVAKML